jgi:hypothetical protein
LTGYRFLAVMLRGSGASSIPETFVLEPMGRGVLDRPAEPGDDQRRDTGIQLATQAGLAMV